MTAVEHRFGPYGGQYVPETLMPALAELEAAWVEARADRGYRAELARLRRDFCGRPTPLYHAERLSEAAGRPVWLKREDLMHTGSHKLNNALGQCLLAKRMGKPRIIAETGAGQHGVATATACALLGLECVVYMGTEDMRRQRPNVQRMRLLGATVSGVDAGSRTLKEAVSAAIRDWVANVGDTHYAIGSCVGPAPFPALVRDLQRVIGDEARAQLLERCGRLPARVIACVGGGSNAIGMFIPFVGDPGVELVGVEAAGEGIDERAPRRAAHRRRRGRGGVLHGSYSAIMQDEDGQITEAHSISAGLDYPGVGPEHAWLRDSGRARYEAVTDAQALAAFRRLAELEGIIPALESSHAVAWVLANPPRRRGRARPDLPLRPRRQGPRRGAGARRRERSPPGRTRSPPRSPPSGKPRGADALPDGRLPRPRRLARDRRGLRRARRRPGRARRAVLRPARRRPGDPRRRHRRAGGRRHRARRARGRPRARRDRPRGAHVLREPRPRARRRALRRRARRSAASAA